MVEGLINNMPFKSPLEPDGNFGHWFDLNKVGFKIEDFSKPVEIKLNQIKDWIEPTLPLDIEKSLKSEKDLFSLWKTFTPMARWEWIRWINSTGNSETRTKRIKVAIDKMYKGERRPCCWNRNLCSEPLVSKNGILITAE